MLPTIITTNLTAEEMAGTYSGRVLDRMKNTAQRLVFNTGSQRRNRWEE
jgi:DNA replication protein DnaC